MARVQSASCTVAASALPMALICIDDRWQRRRLLTGDRPASISGGLLARYREKPAIELLTNIVQFSGGA